MNIRKLAETSAFNAFAVVYQHAKKAGIKKKVVKKQPIYFYEDGSDATEDMINVAFDTKVIQPQFAFGDAFGPENENYEDLVEFLKDTTIRAIMTYTSESARGKLYHAAVMEVLKELEKQYELVDYNCIYGAEEYDAKRVVFLWKKGDEKYRDLTEDDLFRYWSNKDKFLDRRQWWYGSTTVRVDKETPFQSTGLDKRGFVEAHSLREFFDLSSYKPTKEEYDRVQKWNKEDYPFSKEDIERFKTFG